MHSALTTVGHQNTGAKDAGSREEDDDMPGWSNAKGQNEKGTGMGRLSVEELTGKLKEIRLLWLGHLAKREESYVGKGVEAMVVGQNRT